MTPEERKLARKNKLLQRATKNDDQILEAMLAGDVKSLEQPAEKSQETKKNTQGQLEIESVNENGSLSQGVAQQEASAVKRETVGTEDNDESTNMIGNEKEGSELNQPDLFEQYRKMQKAEKQYVSTSLSRKNTFSLNQWFV